MNRTLIYTSGLAVILGTLFAFFLWYGYLQKQKSASTLDTVFASYSPGGGGGGGSSGSGGAVRSNTETKQSAPKSPDEFTNTTKKLPEVEQLVVTPIGSGSDIVGESVRYVDRAKGYIFETNLATGKTERISSTLLPGAFDVQFVSPDTAIVQTANEDGEIVAHSLQFTKGGTATDVPIPLSILSMVLDEKTSLVYALARSEEGGVALVSFKAPYDTSKKPTIVWQSSLTNWRLGLGAPGTVTLQQKAANGIPGHSYILNTKTKELVKMLGDTPGLSTRTSPSGAYTLVTTADGTTTETSLRTEKTGDVKKLARVTFPEKCVWVAAESGEGLLCGFPKAIPLTDLPDIWYRGEFTFDDVLARVDLATGALTEIDTKLDTSVDMIDLKLTTEGSTLVFTDKKSGALWTVRNIR
jgi:hypothetical protein